MDMQLKGKVALVTGAARDVGREIAFSLSAEGAAIDIENPGFVPARFRLVMADDSSVYECRIAWIREKRIGLTFVAGPKGLGRDDGE